MENRRIIGILKWASEASRFGAVDVEGLFSGELRYLVGTICFAMHRSIQNKPTETLFIIGKN